MKKGFTLMELLVTIIILGLIIGISIPTYINYSNKQKEKITAGKKQEIEKAAEFYVKDFPEKFEDNVLIRISAEGLFKEGYLESTSEEACSNSSAAETSENEYICDAKTNTSLIKDACVESTRRTNGSIKVSYKQTCTNMFDPSVTVTETIPTYTVTAKAGTNPSVNPNNISLTFPLGTTKTVKKDGNTIIKVTANNFSTRCVGIDEIPDNKINVSCTNGAKGFWNYTDSGTLFVNNVNATTTCTLTIVPGAC